MPKMQGLQKFYSNCLMINWKCLTMDDFLMNQTLEEYVVLMRAGRQKT